MNEMNLRGRGLHKTYGDVNALAGVDIDIAHGEHVAIMGPSGSGKSTLLHVLSGILTPDEGQVTIGSIAVSGLNDAKRSELRRRVLGFVFQDGQLVRS